MIKLDMLFNTPLVYSLIFPFKIFLLAFEYYNVSLTLKVLSI